MDGSFFDTLFGCSSYKSRACFDKAIKPFEKSIIEIANTNMGIESASTLIDVINKLQPIANEHRDVAVCLSAVRMIAYNKLGKLLSDMERKTP